MQATPFLFLYSSMNQTKLASLRPVVTALSIALLISSVGCKPRGESHSLEQILTDARASYSAVYTSSAGDVSAKLDLLKGSLDKLAGINGGGDARELAGDVVSVLSGLSEKAGMTARPALAELLSQYRAVSDNAEAKLSIGAPNLKLLVARTYSTLATELSTTKFGL